MYSLLPQINKLINSVGNKEELPDQRKKSINIWIYKKGDKTDLGNYRGVSLLLKGKFNFILDPSTLL
jgi:hypothetical protein